MLLAATIAFLSMTQVQPPVVAGWKMWIADERCNIAAADQPLVLSSPFKEGAKQLSFAVRGYAAAREENSDFTVVLIDRSTNKPQTWKTLSFASQRSSSGLVVFTAALDATVGTMRGKRAIEFYEGRKLVQGVSIAEPDAAIDWFVNCIYDNSAP